MKFQFFFSYARADDSDGRLKKFFRALSKEVRDQTGLSPKEVIGFRDTENIQTGDDWSEELKEALQTSRVFICLVSPTYINRDYCGKELQVFLNRLERYQAPGDHLAKKPRVILPVLWIPIKGEIPKALSRLQLHDDDLPPEYKAEGLRYLMRLKTKESAYQEFLIRFAEKVVEVAKGPELPSIHPAPNIEDVRSAFHASPDSMTDIGAEPDAGGPNIVKFGFVAAKKDEMQGVKNSVEYYDNKGGWWWSPYLPAEKRTVGLIAQEAASNENFRYLEMPIDQATIQRLERAEEKKEIVVIVVDPWTIFVSRYKEIMLLYDGESHFNCAALVPWNEEDQDTIESRSLLEDTLKVTFRAKSASERTLYFNDSICSADDLRAGMQSTLTQIRLKIIEVSEAEKRIQLKPSPKPTIPTPGGDVS